VVPDTNGASSLFGHSINIASQFEAVSLLNFSPQLDQRQVLAPVVREVDMRIDAERGKEAMGPNGRDGRRLNDSHDYPLSPVNGDDR
jgi:hypothetical protein